ncbi:glycosyltransferase [Paenibacillus protaetiae]|uniref:Glycosyltransferase n=1 Tax=Paenibacillus protaetiae TaxID=2509456 RepID=A0A4P6EZN0_9BACL|nr:glycosyltransferase [Paenibacillus protaetiae]QAY67773.1 glycosyltransferase [Paenibacillus protaetiae]
MIIDIVLGIASGRGGLETVVTNISQELKRRGHRVRVFQTLPPRYKEWSETLPENYYYALPPEALDDTDSKPFFQVEVQRFAAGYRSLLEELGCPDVVLAAHTPLIGLVCNLALNHLEAGNRPPIISWLHGPPEAFGQEAAQFMKYSDAHMVISRDIGRKIEAALPAAAPIYYVGNPIDARFIEMVARPQKGPAKLLYIGRIDNNPKRLDVLFRSLQFVQNWELQIIGDGDDRAALEQLAEQLHISDSIQWNGWKEDPWAEVKEASLLVLSSDYEGFGMVLIEALARGIPVLSTSCGGPDDIIIHGVNGWLYPVGDSGALQRWLQQIIEGTQALPSPQACLQSIEPFALEQVAAVMIESIIYTKASFGNDLYIAPYQIKVAAEILIASIEKLANGFSFEQAESFAVSIIKPHGIAVEAVMAIIELFSEKDLRSDRYTLFGIVCWNLQMYDYVIPLLQKALQLAPQHSDALYNMGYVLHTMGEHTLANQYFSQIPNPDEELLALINHLGQ